MKVGTLEMYNDYNEANYETKLALTNDIINYKKTLNYLTSKLENYKHYIINFTNIDYNNIKNLTRPLLNRIVKNFINPIGLNIDNLVNIINSIAEINKTINKYENDIKFINESDIDKELFKDIIYSFNNKISDEIIYKAYIFRPGFGIGNTRIKKVRTDLRIKKRINWGESNKLRKEILSRGGLPYAITERDENGKAISHNGGEAWFIYFNTDFDYLWHWGKKTATSINIPYYKFRPTRYNNTSKEVYDSRTIGLKINTTPTRLGNVNKLKALVTSNSPLLNNFVIYEYI